VMIPSGNNSFKLQPVKLNGDATVLHTDGKLREMQPPAA